MSNKVIVVGIYNEIKKDTNLHSYFEFEIDDVWDFSEIEKRIHVGIGDTEMKSMIYGHMLFNYGFYVFCYDGIDYTVTLK